MATPMINDTKDREGNLRSSYASKDRQRRIIKEVLYSRPVLVISSFCISGLFWSAIHINCNPYYNANYNNKEGNNYDKDYIASKLFGESTDKKKPQVKGARLSKGAALHVLRNNNNNENDSDPSSLSLSCNLNYETAKRQSLGFFDDMTEIQWELMRDRVQKRINHCTDSDNFCPKNPNQPLINGKAGDWYQDNWEPDFTCQFERRIGGMGDGPKWVCDPHRIARDAEDPEDGCLVYSIGSSGQFSFEEAILKEISPHCEIHTFDPEEQGTDFSIRAPDGVHYHAWGVENKRSDLTLTGQYKTLQDTFEELGHADRTIDIFKIDCEGCEWTTFSDWFDAAEQNNIILRQILVEVHSVNEHVDRFFETLQSEGYVTFHKEANIKYAYGNFYAIEYAMLKLDASFYDGMDLVVEEFPPATRAPVGQYSYGDYGSAGGFVY